jgi:hypothetical protein
VVPGRSRVRRIASAVPRCPHAIPRCPYALPATHAVKAHALKACALKACAALAHAARARIARPVIRRLLVMAGVAVAGWLLGVAGQAHADQAHADIVPDTRLPSVVAPVEDVGALAHHVLPRHDDQRHDDQRHDGSRHDDDTAVDKAGTTLAPAARPPAILALPPAASSVLSEVSRPRTPVGTAGPSRTQRHGDAGSRAGVSGGPVSHIGPRAVAGASERVSADRVPHRARTTVRRHKTAHHAAPSVPRQPRPLPQRGQALPPSADSGGVIHQVGVRRRTEPGTAQSRPAFPVPRAGTVPPAVRTAADEPSFSPD